MNNGTKLRTIFVIVTTVNTMLMATDVTQFGNETVNFAYKLVSLVVNALAVGLATYFNNDFTEEACIGTGLTRQLKAQQSDDYIGEVFEEIEDDEVGEEDEQ